MNIYQERLKQYIKNTVQSRHVCMGCDMGDAGPGPRGKHDAACFLLETQEEINKLKKDFEVMREITIDLINPDKGDQEDWAEKHIEKEFKRRRGDK